MEAIKLSRLGQLTAPLSLAATMALGFTTQASAISLGPAADYNVFVLGDVYQTNTDIEGKLAVGGNVLLSSFGVGDKIQSGDVLIAGGNLDLTNGQIYGNAIYGGSKVISKTDLNSKGANVTGTLLQGNPLNFEEAGNYLRDLSASLSQQTVNGTTTINNNAIALKGTDSKLNVFNLSGAQLKTANSFSIDAAKDSTVVVNISGADIDIGSFGFFLNNGLSSQNVLYNFYEATNLKSSGSGFEGSFLAANADFTFNNGQINGNLIVKSLTGTGESHNNLFKGNLPESQPVAKVSQAVPDPATLAGLGLVAAMGAISRRKGKQKA